MNFLSDIRICSILSLVIAANFGSAIRKIQHDANYQ